MMKNLGLILLSISLCYCQNGLSQKQFIKPLNVGDKVPDITFKNVLNYKSKKAKLSDYKGKLVILDLWSTWCTSCIQGFPKMEALQKKFNGKLQILLVNPYSAKMDSEQKIITLLNKLKERTGFYPSLPIPINDTVLSKYFPHRGVPHQVWISAEGKVLAISSSANVTEDNIQKAFEGKLDIPAKDDWAFDNMMPLLIDGNAGAPNDFLYRTLFTAYRPQIAGNRAGPRHDRNGDIIGYYLINYPLRELIYNGFQDSLKGFGRARIIVDLKDPAIFYNEDEITRTFCYDISVLPTPAKKFDLTSYLRKDLESFFKISVRRELRKKNAIVFRLTTVLKQLSTKNSQPDYHLEKESIKKYVHNYSVDEILKLLEYYIGKPLINETGISYNINIDFPDRFDLTNQQALLDFLRRSGFEIKEEERELEVVVITDK